MEEIVSKELEASIDGIVRIIPSIRKLISHIINVLNHEQVHKGDINL